MQESRLLRRWLTTYLAFSLEIAFVACSSFAHAQVTTQLTVPASPLWTDTGIALSAGQYATISASGTWCWSIDGHDYCNGPDGNPDFPPLGYDEFEFFDTFDHGRLVAFIGADPYQGQWGNVWFFAQTSGYVSVGSGQTFTAPYSGELWLGVNAGAVTQGVSDNSGQLIANITVGGSDTTAPAIKITSPTSVYLQNKKYSAGYSCTDSNDPVESCNGTVADHSRFNTSSTGPQAFTVVAVDTNGNSSSKDVVYFVGNAGLSPQSLVFPPQIGSSRVPQKVTLYNRQSSTLNISSIATSGRIGNAFTDTTTCDSTLAALKSCTISVTFVPLDEPGAHQGWLTVSTDAGTFTTFLAGYQASAAFLASSLTFKTQTVGTTSAAKVIALVNDSTTALNISSINLTGDFALASSECPDPGELSGECVIYITFTPTAVGRRTGTLIVQASSPIAPAVVTLQGTGD
jgi:hypothetical protein